MSEFLLFGGILEVKKKKKAVRFLSPKRNHCCREVNLSVPSPLPWVQVGSLPDVNQKEVTELHFSAVSQSKPGLLLVLVRSGTDIFLARPGRAHGSVLQGVAKPQKKDSSWQISAMLGSLPLSHTSLDEGSKKELRDLQKTPL